MNRATKAAVIDFHANPFQLRALFFHSSPLLERRRTNQWDSRYNHYSRRFRKLNAKQSLLRNVSAFTEHLFQSWKYDYDDYDPSSSQQNTFSGWEHRANRFKGCRGGNKGPRGWSKKGFQFCENDDDIEFESIFRSKFGGNGYAGWSFVNEEWRTNSSGYSNRYKTSWDWRYQDEEEYDDSTESDSSVSDLSSDRLTLGLSVSGPLSLGDVKNAYRGCALKWHPDRHQGPSKTIAEEKFKVCSAAYQSLCDKLALN